MTRIILDIETIPSQKPGAREQVRASLKPPATMKLPATIEKWWTTEADAAVEEGYRKQSLDGGNFGEIISIAVLAVDNDTDAGWAHCRTCNESEAELLGKFVDAVVERIDAEAAKSANSEYNFPTDPFFVCHNSAFDLPYIWRRCIVNSIRLPFRFPDPSSRVGKDFGCTMTMWAGFNGRVSLDNLCNCLGIESPKGEMNGSQVFDYWLAGRHEEIARYNMADVVATAAVFDRLQGGGQ